MVSLGRLNDFSGFHRLEIRGIHAAALCPRIFKAGMALKITSHILSKYGELLHVGFAGGGNC